ncbi:MAG: hypothetical protein IJW86_00355 [Clostridia bacterium]|nr:hypothetical protein [Clostridia bacterium]
MKKLICLLICLSLLVGIFSSCGDNDDITDPADVASEETTTTQALPERKIVLGYYKGKSLNPFKTDSPTNKSLMTLVYDSLFLPGENYTAEPLIAISFTNNEKMLTVTLDSEAMFSDGSYITPHDVVYSFNSAKDSVHYSSRLQNFSSASAGVDSVTFTLVTPDIFAENCLTFPIVKEGTADNAIPTGSGRYTMVKKKGSYTLIANENSVRQEEMSTASVSLVPITSDKGELYLLQTGDLTYFFDDLSDGEYTKIRANTVRVSLNNMVYLGINCKTKALKNKDVKEAICYILGKSSLCDSAYSGIATASDIPFNPSWQAVSAIKASTYETSPLKAEELLESAGYKYEYSTNKYRSKGFEFLTLRLIVNSESAPKLKCAEAITKSLRAIGVDIRLQKLTYEEYISALQKGEYDLYIGEVKLTPDMSLTPFFSEKGSVNYGIDTSSATAKAYYDFLGGKIDISTFIQVFSLEKPFIPLLFREGIAYYSRELTYEDTINEYEPFRNIYSWSVIN